MSDWKAILRERLAGLDLDPGREADIIEELSQHLDQRYQDLLKDGHAPAAAMDLAGRELLDADTLAAYLRPLRQARRPEPVVPGAPRTRWIADLGQDLRVAVRLLRKQAGLSAAAILTLALGIGATGAMFSLVDTVLLRDLPFPASERLVSISESTEATPTSLVSPVNLLDWQRRSRSFDAIGGHMPFVGAMVMSGPGGPETVPRQWATEGVFRALGVNAVVGRTFMPEDDVPGSSVVVLAESYWRNRFNADASIVGDSIRLDGRDFTVVGVVPDEAQVLGRTSVWALAGLQNVSANARGAYVFRAVARLRSGVSIEDARADLATVAEDLAQEFPATNAGRSVSLTPLRDTLLGTDLRRSSVLFLGIVGLVLLICFANIANLLLTRTAARAHELSIRAALGANRGRLLRQFWTENLVLSILGGVAGLFVAGALLQVAPSIIPSALMPTGIPLAFDARIAIFCGAAALVVGILFSLASATQVVQLAAAGQNNTAGRVTDRSSKTRELLVVAQVAIAVALLYGAGLLSRTLLALDDADPGYQADSVLSMLVDPHSRIYPTPESLLQFYGEVEAEVEALASVAGAAWTSTLPLGDSQTGPRFFEIVGEPAPSPAQRPVTQLHSISGDYFRTIEQPLLTGRTFDARDTADGVPVCIVNEAFVSGHLAGRPAVGERVARWLSDTAGVEPAVCEIVGVAGNTRSTADELDAVAQLYVPFTQFTQGDVYLLVRPTAGDAEALAPSVRAAIGRIDREQLVGVREVMTLDAIGREATSAYRFRATLVVTFGALALLLAMVGLFGVLAYSVQRRWREYGVRKALGATAHDLSTLIGRSAVRLVAPGVLVGSILALLVGKMLGALLFGVGEFDATTLVLVLAALSATAAVSIISPALRAARIDPAGALRSE
jgi:putative ABC transport system permease protein